MKLGALLSLLETAEALPRDARDREVLDLAHDSRKVHPGSLFVAVRGFHSDGHRFIPQALRQGAVAVVAEENSEAPDAGGGVVIRVPDTRAALARLAVSFYGDPSR